MMSNPHAEHVTGGGSGHLRGHKPAKRGGGKNGCPVCPYCREKDEVIPILYGFPSDKAFLKAERGEVYLGGYITGPTAYYCKRDDREF
jgi:hypothetical protein